MRPAEAIGMTRLDTASSSRAGSRMGRARFQPGKRARPADEDAARGICVGSPDGAKAGGERGPLGLVIGLDRRLGSSVAGKHQALLKG